MSKVYGPYKRKDGRKHVIIIRGKSRRTVSYPKYLVEQKLGKRLGKHDTVDHVDRNKSNDNPRNLKVLKRAEHSALDTKRLKPMSFKCPSCGKGFVVSGRRLTFVIQNRKKKRQGPYCSRKCAGTRAKSSLKKIVPKYMRLNKR